MAGNLFKKTMTASLYKDAYKRVSKIAQENYEGKIER